MLKLCLLFRHLRVKTQQDVAEDRWNKVKGALNLKDLSMEFNGYFWFWEKEVGSLLGGWPHFVSGYPPVN